MRMSPVPILTFHDLAVDAALIAFAPDRFAALMARLAKTGWQTMGLTGLAQRILVGEPLPAKHFVVTFDDGYASAATHAAPVLAEHGFDATLFLSAGTEGGPDAQGEPASLEGRTMLTWSQVEALADAGWDIAAHGMNHRDLTTLSDDEVEAEIVDSLAAIGQHVEATLGFSYPFGRLDERVQAIAARHTDVAVSDRLAMATSASDVHALERIEMFYFRRRPLIDIVGTPALGAAVKAISGPRNLRRRVGK